MAHTLVFWKDSLDVNVIKTSSIVRDSELGLCACWDNKLYPIKVLKKHDNATWLNSHVVNTNGMIISEPPAPRKLPGQQKSNDLHGIRRKVDGPVVYQSSIFINDEGEEEDEETDNSTKFPLSESDSEDDEPERKETQKDIYSKNTTSRKTPIARQESCSTSSREKANHRGQTSGRKSDTADNDQLRDDGEFATFENGAAESEPCGKCRDFPTITEKAMSCLENIVDYVKERYVSQGTTSRQPIFVDKTRLHKVEVLKGSGIWMASVFLEIIASRYKKNPKEMTRQLLKRMYSPEELPNLAVDELPGRNKIPNHVYETIEGFVFRNTLERYRLGAAAFKHCVTTTVCTARTNERKKDGTRNEKSKKPTKPGDERESSGSGTGRGKLGSTTSRKGSKITQAEGKESVEIPDDERDSTMSTCAPSKPNTRSTDKSIVRNAKTVDQESSNEHPCAQGKRNPQITKSKNQDSDIHRDKKFPKNLSQKPEIIDVSANICNLKKNREGNFVHQQRPNKEKADNTREVKTAPVGSRSNIRIDPGDDYPSSRKHHFKQSKRNTRSLFSESDSEKENKVKRMKFNTPNKGLKSTDNENENPKPWKDPLFRKQCSPTPTHELFDDDSDSDYFN